MKKWKRKQAPTSRIGIVFGLFGLIATGAAEAAVVQKIPLAQAPSLAEATTSNGNTELRVLLGKGAHSVAFDFSSSDVRATGVDGRSTAVDRKIRCALAADHRIHCGKKLAYRETVTFRPADIGAWVRYEGKQYSGALALTVKDDTLYVINRVPLETYLLGTVGAEMVATWPAESLKAQAVAARTYALSIAADRTARVYDLDSTVLDQVYGGRAAQRPAIAEAVEATKGQVLTHDGKIVRALYHSKCGGQTEPMDDVWTEGPNAEKGISLGTGRGSSIPCPHCRMKPSPWTAHVHVEDLLQRAKIAFTPHQPFKLSIEKRSPTGRAQRIHLEVGKQERFFSGEQLRNLLGYHVLKSTSFTWRLVKNVIEFHGVGSGHGTGMCQWGARALALRRQTYAEILRYFYPHATLETWPRRPDKQLAKKTERHEAKPDALSASWDEEELSLLLQPSPGENREDPRRSARLLPITRRRTGDGKN